MEDLVIALLEKTSITSWNIHQNTTGINLNIKVADYSKEPIESLTYRKESEKQPQRDINRAQE